MASLAATKIVNAVKGTKSTSSSKFYTENSVDMLEARLSKRDVKVDEINSITQKVIVLEDSIEINHTI